MNSAIKRFWSGTWVIYLLLLVSCQGVAPAPQTFPEKVMTSVASSPMVSESSTDIWPDPYDLNPKVETKTFVEELEPKLKNSQLRYPMDLAVSQDGKTVYVLNRNCGSLDSGYVSRPMYGERYWFGYATHPLKSQHILDCYFEGVSQKLIYKIHSNGELGVLTIKGQVPFSLQLGEDLEMDSESNLYFTVPFTHRIYKFNPDTQDLQVITQVLNYVPVKQYRLVAVQQATDQPRMGLIEGPAKLQVSSTGLFYFVGNLTSAVPYFYIERFDFSSKSRTGLNKGFDSFNLPVYVVKPDGDLQVTDYIPYDYMDRYNPDFLNSVSVINSKGEIFGNDAKNNQIWKWDPESQMRVPFAGSGKDGYKDGVGLDASFRFPMGLAVDGQDNLYVSDMGNHAIRKITTQGVVTTFYKSSDAH